MQNRFRIRTLSAAMIFAASFAAPGIAQASEGEAPLVNEKIIVTAPKVEETKKFVEQVTAVPKGVDQIARWSGQVCVSVAGLPEDQAQFMADRVSERAKSVGLRPAKPGCKPDIMILVTDNPTGVISALESNYKGIFGSAVNANSRNLSNEAYDLFRTGDQPVRWWHVSERFSSDGKAISGDARSGSEGSDMFANVPVIRGEGSRLKASIRQDMRNAVVIIDSRQVAGKQMSAIADYVSFVALTQVDPTQTRSGLDTILNLFDDNANKAAPDALTSWDEKYLDAVYSIPRNTITLQKAKAELIDKMQK